MISNFFWGGVMKILVACEESQVVCNSFRSLGFLAYSCDVLPTSGIHPEWHIQCDVLDVLYDSWDCVIAFPPCTNLCVSGARWFPGKVSSGLQKSSIDFFMIFANLNVPFLAIENPIGIMSSLYRKPDQIIQPWQFGHGETKATCLWLKNLPTLIPTNIVPGREHRILNMGSGHSYERSKTYPGIAFAMASQWGDFFRKFT